MRTFLFLFSLSFAAIASAQSVTLDSGFANNGSLTGNYTGFFNDFALQANGKLIVSARKAKTLENFKNFVLSRYFKDGSLDTTFGRKGYAILKDTNGLNFKIAVDKHDAIIAAGSLAPINQQTRNIIIKRFTKNGTLDSSFGINGNVIFKYGKRAYSYLGGLLIQPDGKILVSGFSTPANYNAYGFVLRYMPDGKPDSTFGTNGISISTEPEFESSYNVGGMALQQDGKILVNWFTAVKRFNANGSDDVSFGNNSIATFPHTNSMLIAFTLNNLLVQQDGKIVGCGFGSGANFSQYYFAASRLNTNGSVDVSFGDAGLQQVAFNPNVSSTPIGALQTDDKILLAGSVNYPQLNYAITRLTAHGTIDSGFGNNGRVVSNFGVYTECLAILLQKDNKILLGGNIERPATNYLVARYNNTSLNKANNIKITGIKTNTLAISLSPNPVGNYINIKGISSDQKSKVTIINFSGSIKIQTILYPNVGSCKIDVSSLKQGNYILKVETKQAADSKTFIKN